MKVVRRTHVPRYPQYDKYKPLLREDFHYRCAYCRHHERVFGLLRSMTIDHFRPKSLFPHLRVQYSNLYYCCCECNTYKSDRWPADEELAADLRFVDVCTDEWGDHLEVLQDVVTPKTAPGRFTVEVLRLNREKLISRNRELRVREARIRGDLRRIADMRQRLRGTGGASDLLDLDQLERHLQEDLRATVSPIPLQE